MPGHVIIADHSCLGVFNGSYMFCQQFEFLLTETSSDLLVGLPSDFVSLYDAWLTYPSFGFLVGYIGHFWWVTCGLSASLDFADPVLPRGFSGGLPVTSVLTLASSLVRLGGPVLVRCNWYPFFVP